MKKISKNNKLNIYGGKSSVWTAMLGVSALIGVTTTLITSILNYTIPQPELKQQAKYSNKKETYVRLSPVATRSSIGLWI